MTDDVERAASRRIEWATRTLTQGEILAAFVGHCREELEDVEVLEAGPAHVLARWRAETARIELRDDLAGCTRLASEMPTLLLGDLEGHVESLADEFAADAGLRGRLGVCDLARLEKIGAVRSSVFVYFEWFLRDRYGVKLLPSSAFTQRLIDRGVIHLGFG